MKVCKVVTSMCARRVDRPTQRTNQVTVECDDGTSIRARRALVALPLARLLGKRAGSSLNLPSLDNPDKMLYFFGEDTWRAESSATAWDKAARQHGERAAERVLEDGYCAPDQQLRSKM
jgi:hypothetical protein